MFSVPSFRDGPKDQTRNLEIPRCAIAHLRFDASHRPGMTKHKPQPLNQPWASPVNEKYRPAAVRAQETTSIALSSCMPLSPRISASEITESTNEATSAQRGQFLRRCAASQTK